MKQIKQLLWKIGLFYFIFLSAHAENTSFSAPDSISSNPAAVNINPGTGALQRYLENKLGIINNHGIEFTGSWIADTNDLFSGGIQDATRWTNNSALLLGMTLDTEKLMGWQDGLFGVQGLQFNGQNTNGQAGVLQGYNSLPASPPFNRTELYELWFRQALFNNKFYIRIGKQVPTIDFGNVVRPIPLANEDIAIPAVSSLIYTPVFLNPTTIGVLPGFYNSIYGITFSFIPNKRWYFLYGLYNGSLAQGQQTGEQAAPNLNGTYFHIAETGFDWLLGKNQLPGDFGIGVWHQDGLIKASDTLFENAASGAYVFATQRLWYKNPGIDNVGISSFYQYGINNSAVLPFKKYVGAGLTGFGLISTRLHDSLGAGVALSWLNQQRFSRATELMYQAYYQAKLMQGIYLEPVISYVPTPGESNNLNSVWAGTLRLILLF